MRPAVQAQGQAQGAHEAHALQGADGAAAVSQATAEQLQASRQVHTKSKTFGISFFLN